MTEETYIKERVDDQIKWYSGKSATNQRKHKYWQIIKIVCALLITILSLWTTTSMAESALQSGMFTIGIGHVVGILGAFIVFIESFVKIFNYEELWSRYRQTAERLKSEKLQFQTKCAPYNGEDAFTVFVRQCETIMGGEVKNWGDLFSKKKS